LVEKMDVWKKKRKKKECSLLRFERFEHAKTFLIYVKLWACKLCN
jgi:hypothetical protein